jgi:murein DD-endopeptidase MepM/ murein hydrolase activator NlpD
MPRIDRIRWIATAFACLLLLPCISQAARQSQIEKNRQENKKLYQRINELKGRKKQIGDSLQDLDGRMETKQGDVDKISKQLSEAEARQQQMEKDRETARLQLSGYQQVLGKRARQVYMQGDLSYVDLLFASTSVEDFVDRVFFIQAILEQDTALIDNTRKTRDQLTELLAAVDQQIASIEEIKSKLDTEMHALEEIKRDKRLDLDAIENDEKLYLREIRENEEENKRIAAQIRSIQRSGSGYKGVWKGSFTKPVPGPITSPFGYRNHPIFKTRRMHTGVDIGAPEGTAVHPGAVGKVIQTGWMGGYGNAIIVDHGGGRTTLYGHLSKIRCSVGDEVTLKSIIGEVGSTGNSTGNHLHFEVRINGDPVDPLGSIG